MSPDLMVRSVHVNRLLYGPMELQLSRHQLHVKSRNKLAMSSVKFANPDIRYPDIRIYPLILCQPKIRIS